MCEYYAAGRLPVLVKAVVRCVPVMNHVGGFKQLYRFRRLSSFDCTNMRYEARPFCCSSGVAPNLREGVFAWPVCH